MHLGDHFWSGLEKLIYFVLFPALLFYAIARTRIDFAAAAPFVLSGVAAMGGGMLLGLLARPLFGPRPMVFASQFQCAYRFNSYIGLRQWASSSAPWCRLPTWPLCGCSRATASLA